jgi:hypothetical protein
MYTQVFFGYRIGKLCDIYQCLDHLAHEVCDPVPALPSSVTPIDKWLQYIEKITRKLPGNCVLDVSGPFTFTDMVIHINMVDQEPLNVHDLLAVDLFDYIYVASLLNIDKFPVIYSEAVNTE